MTNTASIYMPIAEKYGHVGCRISHSHNEMSSGGLSGKLSDILSRNITKCATDWFACSDKAAKWFYSEEDVRAGRVKIIANGVETDKFRYSETVRNAVRAELGLENSFVIGNVGRFFPQKNQSFLIRTVPELLRLEPDAVVCFVGEGVDMPAAKALAQELGVQENVRFLGLRSDVNELMQAFDVFVMPSFHEGLPLVGVEAQSAGLPCVFSTGITREVNITGDISYLPLEGGYRVWAEKIASRKGFERKDTVDVITKAGYDISTTAEILTDFYLAHAGKQ